MAPVSLYYNPQSQLRIRCQKGFLLEEIEKQLQIGIGLVGNFKHGALLKRIWSAIELSK